MKTIRIIGLNIDRLIGEMLKNQVEPERLTRVNYDEIIIQISNKQYKKLVDLKILSCYNIIVTESTPTHPLLMSFCKRAGFFVGVLLAVVLLLNINSKIWNINVIIDGEDTEHIKSVVYETLQNKGMTVGSSLNCTTRELEKELLMSIQDSASVIVSKNGINLEITVKMRVKKPELSTGDIVSAYDGKITKIEYSSGILTTNIGEGVSKGQVLIASGKVGDFYAEAVGDIKAKVLISGLAVGSETTEELIRSGNVTEVSAYELFGKTIFFDKSQKEFSSIYQYSDVEREEIFLAKNNCIPIKKVIFKVYELQEKTTIKEKSEVIRELKEQAYKTAQLSLPSGAEELSVSYDVFNDNGYYKVVCNIETEISIGIRQE